MEISGTLALVLAYGIVTLALLGYTLVLLHWQQRRQG